jgi:hypothetical protein
MYYTHKPTRRLSKGQTVDSESFRQTYFESSWFTDTVQVFTEQLCDRLGADRLKIGECFGQYLAVRYHQFEQDREHADKEIWMARYRAYYEYFNAHRDQFVLTLI